MNRRISLQEDIQFQVLRRLYETADVKSKHKMVYVYLFTPTGVAEKSALTVRFLKRKLEEFETLRDEIEKLKTEMPQAPKTTLEGVVRV